MTNRSEGTNDANDSPPQLPYLLATSDDLHDLDFEAPIRGVKTAECHVLSAKFKGRLPTEDGKQAPPTDSAGRVFAMLASITELHFKPEEKNEPFGPMLILANGGRSAAPSDFRDVLDVVAEMAKRGENPMLKARLADLCWLLDRSRANLGVLAVRAYLDIVKSMMSDQSGLEFRDNFDKLYHAYRYILRACDIAWALGKDKKEFKDCVELVKILRKKAVCARDQALTDWFSQMDLRLAASAPAEIASDIERVLAAPNHGVVADKVSDLWSLAAEAYHKAEKDTERDRCRAEAAEVWAQQAERSPHPLSASHAMSNAIAKLSGLRDKRDRRNELKHRLVEIQSRIPEELSTFSQSVNLEEFIKYGEQAVSGRSWLESLFIFAGLCQSPDPEELRRQAVEAVSRAPLASRFSSVHMDREGKTVHQTRGGGFGEANEPAIQRQVADIIGIRRGIVANGAIEAARQTIMAEHFLSDDTFILLLRYSPFVPENLIATFSRGFLRFFQGDFISAIYILTPLLENSLRHILKLHGYDVSTFDDATQTQQDRTLSSLFSQMRAELDAVFTTAITTDIEYLFLTRPGPALRHELAHGLISDGTAYGADAIYGCWLIFSLCIIPLYQCFESTQSESACKATEKSP